MNDMMERIVLAYRAFLREKMAENVNQSSYAKAFLALMKELENASLEKAGQDAMRQGDDTGHLAQKSYHHGFRGPKAQR